VTEIAGFGLENPERLVALVAIPLVGAVLALWGRGSAALGFAAALRAVAAAMVALALAGLGMDRRESGTELCIVFAVDLSESVGTAGAETAERLLSQLGQGLRSGDRIGVLAFGSRAEVVAWPGETLPQLRFRPGSVDPGGTRIAAAIDAAAPLCPEGTERKVVLITDGNENLGDARSSAAFAARAGVRLYPVVPGISPGEGIEFEKVIAPPLVREGSVFPVRVVVRNLEGQPREARLDLVLGGEAVVHRPVRLEPGINVFEIPHRVHVRGGLHLQARLSLPEGKGELHREASIAVTGPVRVLVVSESPASVVRRALEAKDIDVRWVRPQEVPELRELLEYHAVVLDDLPRKALADRVLEMFRAYVEDFGGGLVFAGGAASYGDRDYRRTPLERILPVSFVEQKPPPRGREPMGVFLLVDRSNSMSYNSRRREVRDGEKIAYAKRAALALIAQLRPEDRVGVIAFDSEPYVLGALRPLSEHRQILEDRIARLLPGGGTDFKASLEIAASQLASSGLAVRHIILLTDGDTNRGAADHDPVIAVLARLGITVTAIRIGQDDVNLELLQKIASATGGRFYYVRDVERLPQLLVTDATRGRDLEPQGAPPRYDPRVGDRTQVVRGFEEREFPPLTRLVRGRPKPGADLVIYAQDGSERVPVLATWQDGLGRTASLLLDPASSDGASWGRWPGFPKLWSQLVRWTLREDTPWETRHVVRFVDGQPVLEVQASDAPEAGRLLARILAGGENPIEVELLPVGPRLFRGTLPSLPPGRHPLVLARERDGRRFAETQDVLVVEEPATAGDEVERSRRLPDRELLGDLAATTGGIVDPRPEELLERHGAGRSRRHRLDPWLVPLALVAVLGDIWIRRRGAR
jgi:Mg-chelatase subunit ChlD